MGDLTNSRISETFGKLVQTEGGRYYTGLGEEIFISGK